MSRFLFALSLLMISFAGQPTALAQTSPADRLKALEAIYPPWQRGRNNDAIHRGLDFTVPPTDVLADFHGSLDNPELVLYASGNYFFAMGPLVRRSATHTRNIAARSFMRRFHLACC